MSEVGVAHMAPYFSHKNTWYTCIKKTKDALLISFTYQVDRHPMNQTLNLSQWEETVLKRIHLLKKMWRENCVKVNLSLEKNVLWRGNCVGYLCLETKQSEEWVIYYDLQEVNKCGLVGVQLTDGLKWAQIQENRCPFSLIPVTSLHGTMAYYLYYHTSLVSCFLFPDLSILLLITCCHGYGRPCTS